MAELNILPGIPPLHVAGLGIEDLCTAIMLFRKLADTVNDFRNMPRHAGSKVSTYADELGHDVFHSMLSILISELEDRAPDSPDQRIRRACALINLHSGSIGEGGYIASLAGEIVAAESEGARKTAA